MSEEKLLPCPFCKGKAVKQKDILWRETYQIEHKTGCMIDNILPFIFGKEGINAWNTRASGWIPVDGADLYYNENILFVDPITNEVIKGWIDSYHFREEGGVSFKHEEVKMFMLLPSPPKGE